MGTIVLLCLHQALAALRRGGGGRGDARSRFLYGVVTQEVSSLPAWQLAPCDSVLSVEIAQASEQSSLAPAASVGDITTLDDCSSLWTTLGLCNLKLCSINHRKSLSRSCSCPLQCPICALLRALVTTGNTQGLWVPCLPCLSPDPADAPSFLKHFSKKTRWPG